MLTSRERKIAIEVVNEIGNYLDSPLLGEPDFIRGIFAGVCLRAGFLPSERQARRIFKIMRQEMKVRQLALIA